MKKIIIGAGIVIFIGIMIALNVNKAGKQSDGQSTGFSFGGKKAQEVEAMVIKRAPISSTVLITGNVEVVNEKDVMVNSAVKVLNILVQVGDVVKKGDPLFTVDLSSLEDELASMRLNREIQALQLEKIKSISTSSSLTSGNIAVELAKLSVQSAQSGYDLLVDSLKKSTLLYNEGIISESEIESIRNSVDSAKQQLEVATLNLERSKSELSQIASSNADSKKSLSIDIQIQLKNLENLDFSIVKTEKQMLEMTDAAKAPIKGSITKVHVENNQTVVGGTPLLTINDMDALDISANVREYDIRDMKLGQEVVITGDAIPKESVVKGKISFISPFAAESMINGRQATGIEITVTVMEGKEFLKPGYTTDCEITTLFKDDSLIASYDLFRDDKDNNKLVYIIQEGVVKEQKVTLGITSDFDAEVLTGLNEGDLVVVNPSLSLKDGMKVIVTNNPEEAGE